MDQKVNMKLYKNLLFLIITIVSLSCLAKENDKNFYLKLIAGDSRILPIKENNTDLKFTSSNSSNLSPSMGFGAGYYVNNHFRTDLLIEYLNFHFNKDSGNFEEIGDDIITLGSKTIKRTAYGKSILLNGYINVIEKESYKIFTGIGVGITQIKEKITHLITGNSINQGQAYTFPLIIEKFTSKTANNCSYSFILGSDISINRDLNFEISYSWRNFGKIRHYTEELAITNKYKGHYLSIALRYNL